MIELSKKKELKLSFQQKNVIVGTLLGDAGMSKRLTQGSNTRIKWEQSRMISVISLG